jgi:hypothetical protein
VRKRVEVANVRRRACFCFATHRRIGLDADDLAATRGPDLRRQPRAAAEVDHQLRGVDAGETEDELEERLRGSRPVPVVRVREALQPVAGAVDDLLR